MAVVQEKVEATSASQDRAPAAANVAAGPEVEEPGCAAPSPPAASETVAPAEMEQRIQVGRIPFTPSARLWPLSVGHRLLLACLISCSLTRSSLTPQCIYIAFDGLALG